MVVRFEPCDQDGRIDSIIEIKNISINTGVTDNYFTFVPPAGALLRNGKSPCEGIADYPTP
jgi:outer membrane lipoprotein-sorting protein